MVPPFEEAAFKLAPGQVTLVQTQYGYHVLQVEELKKPHQDTLEEARPKIIAAIKQKEGSDLAHQDVEQDLAAALEGRDLNKLAQKRGLTLVETSNISADEPLKAVESDPKFLPEAFKVDKGEIRAITDTSVPYLVKLVDRSPSHIPAFNQITDKVRAMLIRQKAELMAADAAQAALKQIKGSANFNSVATDNHLQVHSTGTFPRASRQIPGIGSFAEATEAAAMLPRLPSPLDHVLENEGNSFIFEVLRRLPPTEQEWKTEGPAFLQQLLQQKRATTWVNFVNDLKLHTPIVVNTEMIGQSPGSESM